MMDQLLESIRAAVSGDASSEQKAAGAQACRAVLAALEAEAGKPLGLPDTSAPSPLAGVDPTQALDLLIARLRAALPTEGGAHGGADVPAGPGLRISLVSPPPGVPWKRR